MTARRAPRIPRRTGVGTEPGVGTDAGAGTPLVVGLIAVVVSASLLLLGAGAAVAQSSRLAHTADGAALAAADTLLGWFGGDPCAAAERVAAEHGARLTRCSAHGLSVTVTVQRSILSLPLERTSRAGAPDARSSPPRGDCVWCA